MKTVEAAVIGVGWVGGTRAETLSRIEHAQLVHPDDVARFAAGGVAASMQPQHCVTDAPEALRAWGPRCDCSYPWRTLLESGALSRSVRTRPSSRRGRGSACMPQ